MGAINHDWDLTKEEAKALQTQLQREVKITHYKGATTYLGGADISFEPGSNKAYAGITVLHYPSLKEVDRSLITTVTPFPYIRGLLSFREIPPLLKAWDQLDTPPDIFIMDGHGRAHYRYLGLASHFGLWLQRPTIGCAKSRLVGVFDPPGPEKGDYSPLYYKNQKVGSVLRTRTNVKPVFVSPGHLINYVQAREWVLAATTKYKLPETTRRAHYLVNQLRKGNIKPHQKD